MMRSSSTYVSKLFSANRPPASATGGDASSYRYLLQGVNDFPTAEALAEEIRQVGFVNVSFERLTLGIVAIHVGEKSSPVAA